MKRNGFQRITGIVAILFMMSCSDDFITLTPISSTSSANFYKSRSEFETAITAVYRNWGSLFSTRMTEYTEFRADTYTHIQYSYYEISTNHFTTNTTSGLWNDLYKIITNANVILDKIDAVEFDAAMKNGIKAEARFFRAEAYFLLVRFFGAVPLVEHEIDSKQALQFSRAPLEDILALIEADYTFAKDHVQQTFVPDATLGRIHKWAVEGQLARFYVTLSGKVYNRNRWADAKPLLEDILNNSPFKFAATFQEVFADDGSGETNPEIILSVLFKGGSGEFGNSYNRNFNVKTNGLADFEPGLPDLFKPGDVRKDASIQFGAIDLNNIYIDKWDNVKLDWGNYNRTSETSSMNAYVFRYTDAQLLYAELLAEMAGNVPDQALDLLNRSRVRAGLTAYTRADIPAEDLSGFRLAVEEERRCELLFECVRWFDLVRTGRAVEVLKGIGKDADETWLLFPVPQTEIDKMGKDRLPQNPGYPG
ncbi:MAG: RagB/SusD family nutrient uptake outer membrane protein [Tannerella sp.]|jgi:hypothetical protein|nr:RagB/SusD family nutrient uptake outer membrane protein [Tannerella sp.]